MEGNRLILKDGTVIEDGLAGISGGSLCLFFSGYGMRDAALIMTDPEKTGKIIFQADNETVYIGYTDCTAITIDTDGEISVILERK